MQQLGAMTLLVPVLLLHAYHYAFGSRDGDLGMDHHPHHHFHHHHRYHGLMAALPESAWMRYIGVSLVNGLAFSSYK